MAGHYIAKLRQTRAGMDRHQVQRSIDAWDAGASTLATLGTELGSSAKDVGDSFGPDSEVGKQARLVIESVQRGVVTDSGNMHKASGVLGRVRDTMHATEQEADTMPAAAPGGPPQMEGGPYTDDADEIHAMKVHAAKVAVYNQQVSAYNDADDRARVQVEQTDAEYDRAAAFFYGLSDHSDDKDPTGTSSSGTDAGTGGSGPLGTRPTYSGPKHHPTTHTTTPIPTDTTTTTTPTNHPTGPGDGKGPDDYPAGPGQTGPGAGDGPTSPLNPFGDGSDGPDVVSGDPGAGSPFTSTTGTAGTAGLGVLGGLGLRGLLSGTPATVTVPGAPAGAPIGSTTRTGAGSVLGRSATGGTSGTGRGSLAPGQSVGRGAGRGVGAAGAGGRGRRGKDGDDDAEKEIYDVERDWTDDEGQFPGVIG